MCKGLGFGWGPAHVDAIARLAFKSNSAYGCGLFFLVAEPDWPTTTHPGTSCLDASVGREVSSWSIFYTFWYSHVNNENIEEIAHGVWLTTKDWLWLLYNDTMMKLKRVKQGLFFFFIPFGYLKGKQRGRGKSYKEEKRIVVKIQGILYSWEYVLSQK